MWRILLSAVILSSVVCADDLPRTEQLRVLILETNQDIDAQQIICDSRWNAVIRAAEHENDVWARMPFSILEVPGAMAETTEATERWEEQRAIYDYLQSVWANYSAELDGLTAF